MVPNTKQLFSIAAVVFAFCAPSLEANSQDTMVKSIMKLRSDVEALYSKIDENKENYKAQMKSFTMQRADMEAQINRQETSLKLLKDELNKAQIKMASMKKGNEDITPLLLTSIDKLDQVIVNGIPFKVNERREELKKIKSHLKDKTLSPEKGLSMVWASYDDIIRLTKEIGLFKQAITIKGKEKLSQIAKLGSVALYFATPDNEVGYVVKKDGGYSYKVESDEKKQQQIIALFDALKKQIRTGYFTLPNALILEEGK